jgi:hypothetical protein
MTDLDPFVLGLLTEDEFALSEIAGYVSDEFDFSESDARAAAAQSLARLVDQGLVQLLRDPSGGVDESQSRSVGSEILDDSRAWAGGHWDVRAFATHSGLDAYLSSGKPERSRGVPRQED